MLKGIEMVVFDMAGTTINEQNVVYKTLHKALVAYGIETTLEVVLKMGAGKEKHQAIKDILRYINSDKIEESAQIFENFKVLLDKAYEELEVTAIAGVDNVLLQLKEEGVKVVLNTGYNRKVAMHLLAKLNWTEGTYYDFLVTASDVEKGRPHPDMIQKAINHFNISNTQKVLKAGDSAIDIEEGKNANCGFTVGVLSGAQTKEQLESVHPDFILNSLADLPEILR